MEKVNLDTVKPWIGKRVTELLGTDDDVLLEFIVNMLEKEKVAINKVAWLLIIM
jgi:serine/arginine repetitive matrix protein 1